MKPDLALELVPEPDPDAASHDALLRDLLAEGLALLLLTEARAEAEAALGRPLRSADALGDEAALPAVGLAETLPAPRRRRTVPGA